MALSDKLAEPSVCIVLINWNQLKLTRDCLDSLFAMSYKHFKVVVVDNHSDTDPTHELTNSYQEIVVLRQNENLGFAEGNNVGFRYAYEQGFDMIMALNNDTVVDPDFLWALVKELSANKSDLAAVSPKIYFKHNPKMIWALGGNVSLSRAKGFSNQRKVMDNGQFAETIEPDYLTGCCLLIKSEILQSLGGFRKEYFAYYEDTDLSFRLKSNNFRISVIPESVIWHVAGGSSRPQKKKSPFLTYLGVRNRLMFFRSHSSGLIGIYTRCLITFDTILAILFFLTSLNMEHAKESWRGLIDGFSYKTGQGN